MQQELNSNYLSLLPQPSDEHLPFLLSYQIRKLKVLFLLFLFLLLLFFLLLQVEFKSHKFASSYSLEYYKYTCKIKKYCILDLNATCEIILIFIITLIVFLSYFS